MQLLIPSRSDLVCELGPVNLGGPTSSVAFCALGFMKELKLIYWVAEEWLLTFTNAVHPTPMMKVCLCLFKLGMAVDVDEITPHSGDWPIKRTDPSVRWESDHSKR